MLSLASVDISIGIYVCKQLPGANSSPIVIKLHQATGDEVTTFWKVKVKGQGRRGRYALY